MLQVSQNFLQFCPTRTHNAVQRMGEEGEKKKVVPNYAIGTAPPEGQCEDQTNPGKS